MSHELEHKNGRYSFAFAGARDQIWHRLGQELKEGATRAQWIAASGFDYTVAKVPALASLPFDNGRLVDTDWRFLAREDNGAILGVATDQYEPVQPADIWAWFENYISVDDRFHVDAAGVLQNGERLWMTARFNGDMTVAGDSHVARLLMSTSFDATQATRNEATMTRVVCQNTLRLAHSQARAVIRTRHKAKFNGGAVARELAQVAQSYAEFKEMGDAMALHALTKAEVSKFFKEVLDIPLDAAEKDVTTRKMNMFRDLSRANAQTKMERNSNQDDVWTALQAVTRFVDHERTVRGAGGDAEAEIAARFDSGTFGSGDALKGKALSLLMPLINLRDHGRPMALAGASAPVGAADQQWLKALV